MTQNQPVCGADGINERRTRGARTLRASRAAWLLSVATIAAACGGEIGQNAGGGLPDGGAAGSGGGGSGGSGAPADPFSAPAMCTSGVTWTRGDHGDEDMNPGRACIDCHGRSNDAPTLSIAGTLYPSAHEPDLCNGVNGANGARVTITGADGQTLVLSPNTAGNFLSRTKVVYPYRAKVTFMGRERVMATAQATGDCNSCHTQNGANAAPGRILLP
jgi:hypothetical protein